ncbi:MAG: Protein kinase, partial [Labilithrix sp.]|nr:Protein kinase [Labilithrix sp.]
MPAGCAPGSVIGGKYRIERELGRGGFGVVVSAVHLTLDQRVAIKVLTTVEGTGTAEWREDLARFRREARATAALRSEHVVRVLDVDVLPAGNPYLVMEYLEGHTLHHVLHTRPSIPVGEAVDHVVQVLDALAEAHAAGIVHRDMKPANVFLTEGPGGV